MASVVVANVVLLLVLQASMSELMGMIHTQ